MKTTLLLLISFIGLQAAALPVESKLGKSEFLAIGRPAALKISGLGAGPQGTLQVTSSGETLLVTGELTVDLDSFDTGISLRDQHMKEKYLETGKNRYSVLKFQNAPVPQKVLDGHGSANLPAVLRLHGVEKPVEVQTQFQKEGTAIKAVSQFQLKISDFGIPIPSFSGITVADNVQIKIETQVAQSDLKAAGGAAQ